MQGFSFFRDYSRRFRPKTSHAALKALETGFAPAESYMFMATSVKPLAEEPIDLDAIEQTLGRGSKDIRTDLLLMRTLERLLHSSEQEVALFAAESINLIEGRYSTRIEKLKERLNESPSQPGLEEIARLCQDLATLYGPGSSLRAFYLHESYSWLRTLEREFGLGDASHTRLVRVLVQLGLQDQARSELERLGIGRSAEALLLEAEIEFERRNYVRVAEVCRELEPQLDSLESDARQSVAYWLEQDE
jgi:hypothetical protein